MDSISTVIVPPRFLPRAAQPQTRGDNLSGGADCVNPPARAINVSRVGGMVPDDVYELTGVADPRLHPDGKLVAFVVWWIDREESEYRSAIWIAAVDGSSSPRQFTSGEKRDSSPRWSPDGSLLAFTSSRGEEKTSQLYVIPAEGGEARKLTDLKEDPSELAWSPDGSRIAFCARVRDEAYEEEDDKKRRPRRFTRLNYKLDNVGWTGDRRQHLFVVPADGSAEPTQLTDGDFEDASPSWSPEGKRVAFVSARSEFWDLELASDVYVVDAEGGEPTRLTESDGGCDGPVWSPDGSRIAFLYVPGTLDWPHNGRVAVVSATGGDQRTLTESLDRNCAPFPPIRPPIWDGDRILFPAEDSGNVHVYAVPADGSGAPELVLDGERVVTGFDLQNGTLAHTQTTATALAELHVGDRQLTNAGRAFAKGRELLEPERFTAVSEDGTEVDAWIMRPRGFDAGERYPTLLTIHGGPFAQYATGFFDEFQVYAGAGYVVLYANPRGSSGYTEAWGRAIRGPSNGEGPGWGTVDYQDLMAVVDTALERYDFVDADRLGVLGGSYGGFMTTWIVGHTDRFKAAISERAVNNLVSAYGSSDLFWAFAGQFGAYLYEDFDAWVERSPSRYADRITTPLLIMHSENDLRCNIEQGEHLFITLRLRKHNVEMVRFPAESHELSRSGSPLHRVERFQIILDWFDRYLKP
jgi:dipeptidyl aminopeptidase/acylaminoacyl peptidase